MKGWRLLFTAGDGEECACVVLQGYPADGDRTSSTFSAWNTERSWSWSCVLGLCPLSTISSQMHRAIEAACYVAVKKMVLFKIFFLLMPSSLPPWGSSIFVMTQNINANGRELNQLCSVGGWLAQTCGCGALVPAVSVRPSTEPEERNMDVRSPETHLAEPCSFACDTGEEFTPFGPHSFCFLLSSHSFFYHLPRDRDFWKANLSSSCYTALKEKLVQRAAALPCPGDDTGQSF